MIENHLKQKKKLRTSKQEKLEFEGPLFCIFRQAPFSTGHIKNYNHIKEEKDNKDYPLLVEPYITQRLIYIY